MHAGIEGGADRLDCLDVQRTQRLFHLLDDEFDTGAQLFRRSGRFEGELKIIEHGEKLLDGIGYGKVAELRAIARLTLPGVVEFGLESGQAVKEEIALSFEAIIFLLGHGCGFDGKELFPILVGV